MKQRTSEVSDVHEKQNREIVNHSEKKMAISSNHNETIIEFWIVCSKRIIFFSEHTNHTTILEAIRIDWKIFEFYIDDMKHSLGSHTATFLQIRIYATLRDMNATR